MIIPIIYNAILKYIEHNCSLSLTDSGIVGQRKKIFSSQSLQLPIDKIDSIMTVDNISCKLWGGQIVMIRSVSGRVAFPWVQNADEFVSRTLKKIEEYKNSVREDNKNLLTAVVENQKAMSSAVVNRAEHSASPGVSAASKIKELKELLDSGLISQEEFEAKRKQLLDKF
ncbi:MAG: SHOCT domain-containing protein [Ruminococcus sp.]|nr:SHOCT domain-containing protein [Ruminococcus sp.]